MRHVAPILHSTSARLLRLTPRARGVALLCILASCAATEPEPSPSQKLFAKTGNLADCMRGVRTVSLHPSACIARADGGMSESTLRAMVEDALRNTLRMKGIALVGSEPGDRVLAYGIGVSGTLQDDELVRLFGLAPGIDLDPAERRGGLVVVVLDRESHSVLWRGGGSANSNPDHRGNQEEARAGIQRAVHRVLGDLPSQR